VDGARLTRLEAYGKHLFYYWANGLVGHVHLGLFGRFRVFRDGAPLDAPTVRMRLSVPRGTIDLTGPTDCAIGTLEDRDRIVRRLGPDPLRADADAQKAYDAVARRIAPIGQLLLDQKVMSGMATSTGRKLCSSTGSTPTGRATGSRRASSASFGQPSSACCSRAWSTTASSLSIATSTTSVPAGPGEATAPTSTTAISAFAADRRYVPSSSVGDRATTAPFANPTDHWACHCGASASPRQ
jgi:formamidopyrimidine-DNA glycosylase